MRLALLALLTAALLLPLAAPAAPAPKPLSKNLLKNPGAELGPVTPDGATEPLPVPAWETTGGFHVVGYAGYRWAPAPADKTKGSGSKFFSGCLAPLGQTVNLGTATQTASLARWGTTIDKGSVVLTLSAELGGYNGTVNRATAQAVFLNAAGDPVGRKVRLVGPTYLQRQGVTRVEPRSATGAVPVGARQATVTLTGSRAGSGPCGFVDNVRAVVGQVAR
jgi:hypothetical protein